MAFQNKINT